MMWSKKVKVLRFQYLKTLNNIHSGLQLSCCFCQNQTIQPCGGARGKVRGSSQSLGFILPENLPIWGLCGATVGRKLGPLQVDQCGPLYQLELWGTCGPQSAKPMWAAQINKYAPSPQWYDINEMPSFGPAHIKPKDMWAHMGLVCVGREPCVCTKCHTVHSVVVTWTTERPRSKGCSYLFI